MSIEQRWKTGSTLLGRCRVNYRIHPRDILLDSAIECMNYSSSVSVRCAGNGQSYFVQIGENYFEKNKCSFPISGWLNGENINQSDLAVTVDTVPP